MHTLDACHAKTVVEQKPQPDRLGRCPTSASHVSNGAVRSTSFAA
jgi:hypothetical protein